ncbi:MAG TPA: bifunctional hydroxymethylpyrimidine kinase/phosphomethylpyrimidine kinase, partial [Prevotella sp.]|nr:bifunctional hydroxymethylpyrimidine kinase/phosphomethylpyrimidine kinase [Prevotella sp.]
VKIGMVPNAAIAHVIADTLKDYKESLAKDARKLSPKNLTVIYDPVMISTSGHRLMEEECIQVVCEELLPLCTLVTPNLPEAELLMRQKKERESNRDKKTIQALDHENGKESDSEKGQRKILEKQGETNLASKDAKHKRALLPQIYGTNFLVKGGHAEGEDLADVLYTTTGKSHRFPTKKIATHNLHGTGCTLSSAIASYLVKGNDFVTAISLAKHLLAEGIQKGANAHIGKGNGPLLF